MRRRFTLLFVLLRDVAQGLLELGDAIFKLLVVSSQALLLGVDAEDRCCFDEGLNFPQLIDVVGFVVDTDKLFCAELDTQLSLEESLVFRS